MTQINRQNVSRLERTWTYHTGEIDEQVKDGKEGFPFQCTPLVVDGTLYLITPSNRVIALEAEIGKEIWTFDPKVDFTGIPNPRRSRGITYWEGEAGSGKARQRILFGTNDGRLIALDARTGKPCRHQLEPEYLKAADEVTKRLKLKEPIPVLCTLVTASPFDAAVHDAFGKVHKRNCYHTYGPDLMTHDLAYYLGRQFEGEYPSRYVSQTPKRRMPMYHLVGAVDPITTADIKVKRTRVSTCLSRTKDGSVSSPAFSLSETAR